MGRPKGGNNRKYTYEEKLRIVKLYTEEHLSQPEIEKQEKISKGTFQKWIQKYLDKGEEALKSDDRGKTGNRLGVQLTSKSLTKEERLELENMKLRIENERLKKGYIVKGVGANKEYVSINKKSSK